MKEIVLYFRSSSLLGVSEHANIYYYCFVLFSSALPIIPVVLYGVLAFTNNQEFDDTHK